MSAITRIFLMLSLLSLFSSNVHATEEITANIYFHRAGMKIVSGVANIGTGWLELPKNIILWSQKDENALVSFAEGMLWGLYHTASRTATGAIDLVTFWLPTFPTPHPPFVWEDFSEESEYYAFQMGR